MKKAKAKPGKIFVGGLTAELQDEQIKEHFAKFGSVIECEMPFDKVKNQRKNFCFVTFEREETMKELLKAPKQKIGEVEVDVKRATPKTGIYSLTKTLYQCMNQDTEEEGLVGTLTTTTATQTTTAGAGAEAGAARWGEAVGTPGARPTEEEGVGETSTQRGLESP